MESDEGEELELPYYLIKKNLLGFTSHEIVKVSHDQLSDFNLDHNANSSSILNA